MAHYLEHSRASYRRRGVLTADDEPPTIPYEPPALGSAPAATPRTTFLPERRERRASRIEIRGRERDLESGELPTLRQPRPPRKSVDSVWHIIVAAFVAGLVMGVFVMSSLHPR